MFSELTVSGEVLVILVSSKLLGLITCKRSGLSQSATQLWPSIFAGFVLAEGLVQEKRGRSVPMLGVIKCGKVYDIAR